MRHKWKPDPKFGSSHRDMSWLAGRVCLNCGAVQRKTSKQSWQRVVGYYWTPEAKLCVRLKWKKPVMGRQESKCGRYWVERERHEDGFAFRWHPHRSDLDEALSFDYFRTREDAKRRCEEDARNPDE